MRKSHQFTLGMGRMNRFKRHRPSIFSPCAPAGAGQQIPMERPRLCMIVSVVWLLGSCEVYHITPPLVQSERGSRAAVRAQSIPVDVAVEQIVSSDKFKGALPQLTLNFDAAVLQQIQGAIETSRDVRPTPGSDYHVIVRSRIPVDSGVASACLSVLTLLFIPVVESYETPIEVVVMWRKNVIKQFKYSYKRTGSFGTLIPFWNLLFTPYSRDDFLAGGDVKAVPDTFFVAGHVIARNVVGAISAHQRRTDAGTKD